MIGGGEIIAVLSNGPLGNILAPITKDFAA